MRDEPGAHLPHRADVGVKRGELVPIAGQRRRAQWGARHALVQARGEHADVGDGEAGGQQRADAPDLRAGLGAEIAVAVRAAPTGQESHLLVIAQ